MWNVSHIRSREDQESAVEQQVVDSESKECRVQQMQSQQAELCKRTSRSNCTLCARCALLDFSALMFSA